MSVEETQPGVAAAPAPLPAGSPARHRKRRFGIWLVVVLAFAVVLWWVLRENEVAPPRAAGPVTVASATAKQADVPVFLDSIGTVTPVYTASIASQVTGQVMSVHYKEGQLVGRGTPLVDIDPRPFQAILLQAQGALQRDIELLAQAKMDLERFRAAWARNAIAKQQVDDQAKLVLQIEGTVKLDRGVVQAAKVQLDFCHITSPITGRVGLRLVDPGNVVVIGVGTILAVVTQLQPITVVFTIAQDNLSEIWAPGTDRAGLRVDLLDRTKSKQLASGTLIAIDNQIDTTTGTVRLRAQFDNKDEALFPNQFVNTRLRVKTLKDVTTVPSSAIQHRGDARFVYVIGEGRVKVQDVTEGVANGDTTQVDGIAPGTPVANSSFEKLQDGSEVVIAQQAPSTRSPSARSSVP
jgi:multidrug efflux system membrane fusion protein